MGLLSDTPTLPRHPQPRPREGWRGAGAILLSLLLLGACVCLATGITLAGRFPLPLDRYMPTVAGQSSLYRVQYAGSAQGFATVNVVKPGDDALTYAAAYAAGRAIQVHETYTNWLGMGALHSIDTYYSRNGNHLVEVALVESGVTTLFSPPLEAWSPEMLLASQAHPVTGSTAVSGVMLDYRIWRGADATFVFPGGAARPAVRLEEDSTVSNTVVNHYESLFVDGVGLVQTQVSNGQGAPQLRLDLLASTRLPQSASAASLPFGDLVAGADGQLIFFREDAARTGAHRDAQLDPAGLRITYRLQTGRHFVASALAGGGVYYVGDQDGQVAAFDASHAVPRWQFSAGGPIVAAPAAAGGVVYFGAADKTLYAVDARQGMYLWTFHLKDNVATSPVIAGGLLYIGGEDRTLYALDAQTGRLRWTYTTGDRLVSSPAVAAGRAIFGSDDGVIYALDSATGRLLWRYAMDGPVEATPVIAPSGVVFAASNGQEVAAIDAATGRQLWTASTRFGYLASPALGQDRVFAAGTDGALRAYEAASGALIWESRRPNGAAFVGSPLVLGGSVLDADTSGQLVLWSAESGVIQRQLDLGGSVTTSPTWTGQAVLINDASGEILTLQSDPNVRGLSLTSLWQHEFGGANPDPATSNVNGQPIWFNHRPYVVLLGGGIRSLDPTSGDESPVADLGDPVSASPVLSGSVLYVGTDKGRLVAYDLAQGRIDWQAALPGRIRFAPALSEGTVFVDTFTRSQTAVYALDRNSGAVLWKRGFADGNSTPALAAGRLYVAGRSITALDPASGEILWQSDPFVVLGCLTAANGVVYAGRDNGPGSPFVALDGATGRQIWAAGGSARFAFGRPAVDQAAQAVVAGAADGEVFAYDAKTGAVRWSFQADSAIQSDIQLQDGVAYFTAASGDFYAVEAASGRLLANFRPGSPIDTNAAPLVLPDRAFTVQGVKLFALAIGTH